MKPKTKLNLKFNLCDEPVPRRARKLKGARPASKKAKPRPVNHGYNFVKGA